LTRLLADLELAAELDLETFRRRNRASRVLELGGVAAISRLL